MNPQDPQHPDLTAYALGELSPADAEHVRRWLTQSPEARVEFERIQQTIGLLQDAPTLPKRSLHPRQRETVLTMGQLPESRAKNVVPFLAFRRPAGSGTRPSILWRTAKYAAAACLVGGAFMLGQKTASRMTPFVASQDGAKEDLAVNGTDVTPAAVQVAVAPSPLQRPESFEAVVQAPKIKVPGPVQEKPAAPVVVANGKTSAPPVSPPAPQAPKAMPVVAEARPAASVPPSLKGFAQTSVSAEAELTVDPKLIRPLPVPHEFAGVVLASPLPLDAKPAPAQRKAESQPALVIHWGKPEIASCPWDASRRLVRFVAQVPIAQPGIENSDANYKLTAKFDPFQVQGFRLVMDKYMRPVAGATQATRFAWYEIIPTRNFNPSAEKPVTIGTISVEQPRGAASEPLKLMDRGTAWNDASEVFAFETAMIGWNLLLNGTDNTGGLNSALVLDLAGKNRGDDADDERAKFIRIVKQAQKAVGL